MGGKNNSGMESGEVLLVCSCRAGLEEWMRLGPHIIIQLPLTDLEQVELEVGLKVPLVCVKHSLTWETLASLGSVTDQGAGWRGGARSGGWPPSLLGGGSASPM